MPEDGDGNRWRFPHRPYDSRAMTVDELRRFVLGLDEATESSHQGRPDFRYRNRIVVNLDLAEESITIKLPLDEQAALVERNEGAVSLPGGWAKHGWTTFGLAEADDDELRDLIAHAWDDTKAR
jgi:hypothetical protein